MVKEVRSHAPRGWEPKLGGGNALADDGVHRRVDQHRKHPVNKLNEPCPCGSLLLFKDCCKGK